MTMTIQATTCPPWCELDDHADWADRIRIQHRANRAIPISALPYDVPGQEPGHEALIVSLHAWDGSEPVLTLELPESRKMDTPMTAAEALDLAEAIGELTSARQLALAGSAT
jgi:hypothetical protein